MTVIGHGYDDNVGAPAFRNLVINGGFDVWQRGTSFATGTLGSPYYGPDRWQAFRIITASGVTVSRQNSDLAGFNYFVRCQRDSGNTNTYPFILGTSFETVNVRRVQGKYLTLSFWARKNAGFSGSYLDVSVATGTGTDSNMYNGFTSSSTPINTTVALTTSWQRFTFTTSAVMASNITQLGLSIACSTYSGTAGASDYFDITGVQLEAGSVATPFEFEPFETTLRKCQRYYQVTDYFQGTGGGGNNVVVVVPTFFPMRSTVAGGIAGTTWQMSDNYAADLNASSPTIPSVYGFSPQGMRCAIGGFGAGTVVNGRYYNSRPSTTSLFYLSAEL